MLNNENDDNPLAILGKLNPEELRERLIANRREAEGLRSLLRIAERNAVLVERQREAMEKKP